MSDIGIVLSDFGHVPCVFNNLVGLFLKKIVTSEISNSPSTAPETRTSGFWLLASGFWLLTPWLLGSVSCLMSLAPGSRPPKKFFREADRVAPVLEGVQGHSRLAPGSGGAGAFLSVGTIGASIAGVRAGDLRKLMGLCLWSRRPQDARGGTPRLRRRLLRVGL